jgi:hypothetical protein
MNRLGGRQPEFFQYFSGAELLYPQTSSYAAFSLNASFKHPIKTIETNS